MATDSVARAYDVVAGDYEERFLDELASKPRDRQLLDDAVRGDESGVILDVGCGPGQIGLYLQQKGNNVIGVDVSQAMAARAAGRLMGAVVADMRSLPFRGAAVGALVAFYSLIHLPRSSLGAAFGEFARVLEHNGRLLASAHEGEGDVEISEFLGHTVELGASFLQLDELVTAAEAAGFDVISAERRPPYEHEGPTVRLYVDATKRDDSAT